MFASTVSGTGDTAVNTTDKIHLPSRHSHSSEGVDNKYVNKTNNTITDCDQCYEKWRKSRIENRMLFPMVGGWGRYRNGSLEGVMDLVVV